MNRKIKHRQAEICLIITFIISIFSFSFIISASETTFKMVTSRNSFKDKLKYVQIEGKNSGKDLIELLNEREVIQIMTPEIVEKIAAESANYVGKVVGVTSGADIEKYCEITGRILTNNEIDEGKKVAVVGSKLKKCIINVDNKDYIKLFKENFEVVGIIENEEWLTGEIFIPIKTHPDYEFVTENNVVVVDKTEINKVKNIKDIGIKVSDITKEKVSEFVLTRIPEIKENMFMVLVAFLNLVIFSIFYCQYIKRDLAIMRLIGAKPKDIVKYMFFKVSKIYLKALPIGFLTSFITIKVANSFYTKVMFDPISIYNVIITIGLTILIFIVANFIVLFNVLKFNILEDIR